MSDCEDCQQKHIKDDGSTADATAAKKRIKDMLLMTTVASTTAGIFYALRIAGVGFDLMIKNPMQ